MIMKKNRAWGKRALTAAVLGMLAASGVPMAAGRRKKGTTLLLRCRSTAAPSPARASCVPTAPCPTFRFPCAR